MKMLWFGKICPLSQVGHHAKACEVSIQPCYVCVLMESICVVNANLNCYYYVFYFVIVSFVFLKKSKFFKEQGPCNPKGLQCQACFDVKVGYDDNCTRFLYGQVVQA